jgi:hypothetical protein
MSLRNVLAKNFVNYKGWSSNRKLIVFESDDWGSIRMPSKEVYLDLVKQGIPVDKNYFVKNDCLESQEDLECLFKVLSSYKDKNGNHPVITANALVANPDFDKIKESNCKEYFYELISETYKKYSTHDQTLELWKKEGIQNKMLWPQFHGREHLNPMEWMKSISSTNIQEKIGFENKAILGIGNKQISSRSNEYMAAFDFEDNVEMNHINKITKQGIDLFEQTFGFKSKSFVASCSIRSDKLDKVLFENGVLYHQCGQQISPKGEANYKIINRYFGDKNDYGQIYWRRNVSFEPTKNPTLDWVDDAMKEIKIAFRWGKPAVINSHRVNYIGSIFEENRENGLRLLSNLIAAILKEWPESEFMSSDQLGDFMKSSMQ